MSDPTTPESSRSGSRTTHRLLAVLVVILGVAALKLTSHVTLPIAFALFLIGLFWPLQKWLQKRLPAGIAVVVTLAAFLLAVGAIGSGIWWAGEVVSEKGSQYSEQLGKLSTQMRDWARSNGIPVASGSGFSFSDYAERIGKSTFGLVGGFVLVSAFFVLGLLEVPEYRKRLYSGLPVEDPDTWRGIVHRVADDFQRYIVVRTGIGLLTGIGTGLAAWIVGLDFPLVWGMLNFLLNYVPTIGSILGVVPPTLFALVQFDNPAMALLVLGAVGGVQLLMGNYVDPLVQGKYLSLSPFVVLLSVTFWGWVWGVMGALIGVPLTIAIVILCGQFDSTRWIAVMLARKEELDKRTETKHKRQQKPPAQADAAPT